MLVNLKKNILWMETFRSVVKKKLHHLRFLLVNIGVVFFHKYWKTTP